MKSHWQSSAVLYIAIGSVGCSLGYFGFRMRWFPEASYLAIVKYTTPFAIKLGQKEMREDRGEKESNWKGSGKRALSHRLSVLLAANDILALEDELTSIGGKDPLDALEWASALGMPARQMAENRILSAWVRADSANAFSWG